MFKSFMMFLIVQIDPMFLDLKLLQMYPKHIPWRIPAYPKCVPTYLNFKK